MRRRLPNRTRPKRCAGYRLTPALLIDVARVVDLHALNNPAEQHKAIAGLDIVATKAPLYWLMSADELSLKPAAPAMDGSFHRTTLVLRFAAWGAATLIARLRALIASRGGRDDPLPADSSESQGAAFVRSAPREVAVGSLPPAPIDQVELVGKWGIESHTHTTVK